jgi:crotonobetainyl-CoA:carnitine CoA-transferase CaiB-like acyl-CoA transferase
LAPTGRCGGTIVILKFYQVSGPSTGWPPTPLIRSLEPRDVGRNALPASVAKLLVENLAPGTFARLGFDYLRLSEINPRLSFAQVKGCASDSPHANYLAFDMIAQAMGRTMGVIGFPDAPLIRPGASVGDTGAGMLCAMGILAALYQRMTTGRGSTFRSPCATRC